MKVVRVEYSLFSQSLLPLQLQTFSLSQQLSFSKLYLISNICNHQTRNVMPLDVSKQIDRFSFLPLFYPESFDSFYPQLYLSPSACLCPTRRRMPQLKRRKNLSHLLSWLTVPHWNKRFDLGCSKLPLLVNVYCYKCFMVNWYVAVLVFLLGVHITGFICVSQYACHAYIRFTSTWQWWKWRGVFL